MTTLGSEDGLLLELHWDEWNAHPPSGTAAEVTSGSLRLLLRGHVLWQGADPTEGFWWTWVELLEFLAHAWPRLKWEDGLPFGLRPAGPAGISAQAESRWDERPGETRESEAQELEDFEEAHNLARAVQGAWLPSVWVVRQGEYCLLCSDQLILWQPLGQVLSTLEVLGDEIASRLRPSSEDQRGATALAAWDERAAVSAREAVLIATGLSEDVVEEIEGARPRPVAWELDPDGFALNELLATARLAAGLPPATVATLVEEVRSVRGVRTPQLDAMESEAREVVTTEVHRPPFEQGYSLAKWLRAQLGLASNSRVDPERLLLGWRIEVKWLDLGVSDVDAFAAWGPRHGPAIFLNLSGRHNRSKGGSRATLAHELAHLLADRRGALPLAEVLGGRTSPVVEARARAFAAEFLLPSEEAGNGMAGSDDPSRALVSLQRRYGVSQEVVAWQARNSRRLLPATVEALLRSKVSQPSQF